MKLRVRLLLVILPSLILGLLLASELVREHLLFPLLLLVSPSADIEQSLIWIAIGQFCFSLLLMSFLLSLLLRKQLFIPVTRIRSLLDNVLSGKHLTIPRLSDQGDLSQLQNGISQLLDKMRRSHESVDYLANHDPLTGLANQRRFREQLNNSFALSQQTDSLLTLAFVDLDKFKQINDRYGHQAGDQALKGLASRLQLAVENAGLEHKIPNGGMVRLSGDEFAIVLEGTDLKGGERLAQALGDLMEAPMRLGERAVYLSCSIGVVTSRPDSSYAQMLREVDFVMYRAKQSGKGNYCLFDDKLAQLLARNDQLHAAMDLALQRDDELQLYLQPYVGADERIAGAETLLRWHSHELGWISPAEFIPVIEQTELIHRLDRWVLEQAIGWLSAHREHLDRNFRLSVNISSRELRDAEFPHALDRMLERYRVPAYMLELEITETSLTELDGLFASTAHALKSIGVALALDDFGTGYLSLSHLATLPVDKLKIDRSHVDEVLDTHSDRVKLAEVVLLLAQSYRLKITAEGVEHRAQADWLIEHGCDFLQGFYFYQPMPHQEVEALLNEQRKAA